MDHGIMDGEDYTYREHDGKCRYKEHGVVGTPKVKIYSLSSKMFLKLGVKHKDKNF